jgi:hypothetical protein
VKYVILIYSNPESRKVWASMPEAQRTVGYQAYAALNQSLSASGEMIVSEALADPSQAARVTVREGQTLTTDGPFAELKEQLAGFYLIECDNREQAIAHAARVPEAELGLVEVRPVLDLSEYGM